MGTLFYLGLLLFLAFFSGLREGDFDLSGEPPGSVFTLLVEGDRDFDFAFLSTDFDLLFLPLLFDLLLFLFSLNCLESVINKNLIASS